jgi:hypothetical protein
MKQKLLLIFIGIALNFTLSAQIKKYCYTTNSGKYVLSLFDDGSKIAAYQLYSASGSLQKTMSGTWMIRDEGVYGTAYYLTITWTGSNASMPQLKYVAQYDGNGNLQAIIDGSGRTWNSCR